MMMKFIAGIMAGMVMANTGIVTPTDTKIEVVYGIVLNEQGDGKVVVNADDYYNYISYKCVEDAEVGDCIKTICVNVNGECEYRYDTIVDTCIDRYEGDDSNEYCVFEILDGDNIVMGECYAWEYVNAINAGDYKDIHEMWGIEQTEYKDNNEREQMLQRKMNKLFDNSGTIK